VYVLVPDPKLRLHSAPTKNTLRLHSDSGSGKNTILRLHSDFGFCPSLVQRCTGAGVQESTPAGVDVFPQEPEQDQEWIFSIVTGAGVIFNHSVFEILMSICTLRDLCRS